MKPIPKIIIDLILFFSHSIWGYTVLRRWEMEPTDTAQMFGHILTRPELNYVAGVIIVFDISLAVYNHYAKKRWYDS
jgi:hypothetical protein